MGFTSFRPPEVTIAVGDTVEWRNKSLITHSVTDDARHAGQPGDAGVPATAQVFDSGDIPAGQVYRQMFTVPGTYRYLCTQHESEGMVGTVVVKPAS
jgi:plastocyanin